MLVPLSLSVDFGAVSMHCCISVAAVVGTRI